MLNRMNAALFLFLGLGITMAPAMADPAGSEPKLSLLSLQVAVGVMPQIAPPGVPRKIVVAGLWPNGCVPSGAQLGAPPTFASPALGVLLTEPLTFAACTTALTPYRFELDFTPQSAGQVEIVAMTSLSKASGRGTLVTSSASTPRSIHDVSGAWYDPDAWGTGLSIAHDYGQSDGVFATWQFYDPASGTPRWVSLQQGLWQENGLVWKGFVFETGVKCPDCPVPNRKVVFLGQAVLTFSVDIATGGLDATYDFEPRTGGGFQRVANLRRFLPNRIVIQ